MSTLYSTYEWVILILLVCLMLGGGEIGFRIGRREKGIADKGRSEISVIAGSVLGLLALLLGFTTSMAVSRFETRTQLVLEEANAIGTSYLRAKLVPAPDGPAIARDLRDYVDVHAATARAEGDLVAIRKFRPESDRLQKSFWERAVAYAQKDPSPTKAGLLLQSLNQTIDMDAARWMAYWNHVPESVIYVNILLAFIAVALIGYSMGLVGARNVYSSVLLALAFSLVITLIIDLDRPQRGIVRVSQQPIFDLQQQLHSSSDAAENSTSSSPK